MWKWYWFLFGLAGFFGAVFAIGAAMGRGATRRQNRLAVQILFVLGGLVFAATIVWVALEVPRATAPDPPYDPVTLVMVSFLSLLGVVVTIGLFVLGMFFGRLMRRATLLSGPSANGREPD